VTLPSLYRGYPAVSVARHCGGERDRIDGWLMCHFVCVDNYIVCLQTRQTATIPETRIEAQRTPRIDCEFIRPPGKKVAAILVTSFRLHLPALAG
jgi:hypothetical protein